MNCGPCPAGATSAPCAARSLLTNILVLSPAMSSTFFLGGCVSACAATGLTVAYAPNTSQAMVFPGASSAGNCACSPMLGTLAAAFGGGGAGLPGGLALLAP